MAMSAFLVNFQTSVLFVILPCFIYIHMFMLFIDTLLFKISPPPHQQMGGGAFQGYEHRKAVFGVKACVRQILLRQELQCCDHNHNVNVVMAHQQPFSLSCF